MICPSCGHEVDDRLFVDEICVQCVNDLAQYNDSYEPICSDLDSFSTFESLPDPEA